MYFDIEFQDRADYCFDEVLASDDSNSLALYGKSLVCYQQGKIEKSAENLRKAMENDSFGSNNKSDELKAKLLDLLEPKPTPTIFILDEMKKKYEDMQQHEVSSTNISR